MAAFEASLDADPYSFLLAARAYRYDLILVGYNAGTSLAGQANTVTYAIRKVIAEHIGGDNTMTVGGIGRGALVARYALASFEARNENHQVERYFSYNGTVPSQEEGEELKRLRDWPIRPLKIGLVSADFTSEMVVDPPEYSPFDEGKKGAANPGGQLITSELGSWLLNAWTARTRPHRQAPAPA
ncbi:MULTISPECIES: hypothetical protein [unclassified Streptomyces]|uniref:hypothetical protein n=1 Tax=unclassified Streptomyces TaxID=2593676 RepID=UPI000DC7D503|nr:MULTISPECIES: hypothetical protein [unclassified Streptomyces]AWZ08806.1 hypothetical protein DRB89_34460 [Streptomyces sp. ICC4]AWZ14589.1 hypothetical protein DRB96_22605 [Streptomyces sp. ICC1]